MPGAKLQARAELVQRSVSALNVAVSAQPGQLRETARRLHLQHARAGFANMCSAAFEVCRGAIFEAASATNDKHGQRYLLSLDAPLRDLHRQSLGAAAFELGWASFYRVNDTFPPKGGLTREKIFHDALTPLAAPADLSSTLERVRNSGATYDKKGGKKWQRWQDYDDEDESDDDSESKRGKGKKAASSSSNNSQNKKAGKGGGKGRGKWVQWVPDSAGDDAGGDEE